MVTQDHGVLERAQDLLSRRVFVHQPLGDEDGIVVSLTEDEGREDDIDNVELQAEQAHRPEDPDPTHRERQESGDTHRQAQGQAQEEKDDDAAQKPDPVEILRQHPRQRPRNVVHRETECSLRQCRPQRVHDISDLPVIPGLTRNLLHLQVIHHMHSILPRQVHRRSQRSGDRPLHPPPEDTSPSPAFR